MNHAPLFRRFALFILAASAGAGIAVAAPSGSFIEVDRAVQTAFASQQIPGMGLAVYDASGVQRFEKVYGDFSPDKRIAIASASKLVAGLTLLRLVDEGKLALDSTTGKVLGWTGPQAAITLKQLLSFTSGLTPEASCTLRTDLSLADCADSIGKAPLASPPGSRFDYGSTHLQVAARMAEVVTGRSWHSVFVSELREPLALSADIGWYTRPRQSAGTSNPLIAGGLRMTMNEYARVLDLEYHRGVYNAERLISDALFTAQATEPYPHAVIGNSPVKRIGLDYHYGLASWLECPPPATNCAVQSSPGAFGFTPWVDRPGGYYAILGMEAGGTGRAGVVKFSVELARQLRPLIRAAVAKH
jgi:CubicO group peptidase (beta-lactamase class C family)